MRQLIHLLFRTAHRLMPKRDHAVIWGWPDGNDNQIALEESLQGTPASKVVLLADHPDTPPSWHLGKKSLRIRKNSACGILYFLTARYVFITHPCFTRKYPANVVSVNIWHGMPIKKIGSQLPGDGEMDCKFTTVTSPFWGDVMKRAMRTSGFLPDVGLPRNDRLFHDPLETRHRIGLRQGQKLVVWLPTYRSSIRGLPRVDGHAAGNPFEMPDIDPSRLNAWLAARDTVLIVKPHPMADCGMQCRFSNLWIINDEWLGARATSLYQLLGATRCLLSDVSSVVIDYLLLNRPVIHTFADIDEYRESRGFMVEPIEDYLAGPIARNEAELLDSLDPVLTGSDPFKDKREALLRLSHTHKDGGATRRLLQLIGLLQQDSPGSSS